MAVTQINLHKPLNEYSPNVIGELFLDVLNTKLRWGYMTRDFDVSAWRLKSLDLTDSTDLLVATLCCGCEAKSLFHWVEGWNIPALECNVYLHWDGDGTIVFVSNAESWVLYNMDCKKDNEWEWHFKGDWTTGYWDEPLEDGTFGKGRG